MHKGVFTVLEQVNTEEARAMDSNYAMSQFWKTAGKLLWKVGKNYLRRKYCSSEEQQMRAMLQELVGEQGMADEDFDDDDEDMGDGDGKAIAELQTIFSALKKAEAKMKGFTMDDDKATTEGWWKKARRWASKKIKGATKKYLC